jgi:uncharacterized protein (TIGR02466 family)
VSVDRFSQFATPVVTVALEDVAALNDELRARLVAEADASPGIHRSNHGGWHSVPDLTQRQDACYRDLMARVIDEVRGVFADVARSQGVAIAHRYAVSMQAWAMVMRAGDHAVVHDHAQAHWAVVYYVDAGDADLAAHPRSGELTLVDPRRGVAAIPGIDLFPTHFSIRPVTGMLVVFPGTVQHFVHPYRGTRPRVSVSCNVRLEIA